MDRKSPKAEVLGLHDSIKTPKINSNAKQYIQGISINVSLFSAHPYFTFQITKNPSSTTYMLLIEPSMAKEHKPKPYHDDITSIQVQLKENSNKQKTI